MIFTIRRINIIIDSCISNGVNDEEYKDFDGISKRVPHGIGEVSTLEMRRMETLEEVAAWQKKVQEIVMENSEHHIPAIFHMEGLCGPFIQDSTSFPAGIGRGAGFDPEVEETEDEEKSEDEDKEQK